MDAEKTYLCLHVCLQWSYVVMQEQQSPNTQIIATDSASAKAAVAKAVVADPDMEAERKLAAMVCSLENKDECLMCGS